MPPSGTSSLTGFDLNATRVRGVSGSATALPHTLPLGGTNDELPLALSLEWRSIQVGQPGLALCRRAPHLACLEFLGQLGEARQWQAGRHSLDATRALSLVCQHLYKSCVDHCGLGVAVPAYLTQDQLDLLTATAVKARLPVLGTIAAPLATALTAYSEHPWSGPALVVDVDDHALSWSAVVVENDEARLLAAESWPVLGLRSWKERLLDVLADRCVRQSRRDPRDCGDAEQSLYEQLDPTMQACCQGQMAEVAIQTTQWYQNLIVQPAELASACAHLARQALDAMHIVKAGTAYHGSPGAVLLTAMAAQLPGLAALVEDTVGAASTETEDQRDDFGESLVESALGQPAALYVMPPDAAARAAHALAVRWQRGEIPRRHLDAAPLLPPPPPDAGPPRLHFRGQEFLLRDGSFTLGRHPHCDLVFDSAVYPTVSARHCEIVYDRHAHILRDRSRHGTLINDRPVIQQTSLHAGDWIRLGPNGPLLRFLGQVADQRRLMPTA
jgi:hypothetical protein